MRTELRDKAPGGKPQWGMTLIETVTALAILLIVAAGIMTVAVVSVSTTENQGHLAARTSEYAQDKMEQLIGLAYADGDLPMTSGTDTTVFPSCGPTTTPPCTTGTGLAAGGSADPATPGTGYVDYLCNDGSPIGVNGCTAGNWYYIRVWQISSPSSNMKQITVTARVRYGVGTAGSGALAQSTVTSMKTNPY